MMHNLNSKKTLPAGRIENVEMYNLYRGEPTDAVLSVMGKPRLYAAEGVVPVGVDTSGVIVDDGTGIGVLDTDRAMTCVVEQVDAVVHCALPMRNSLIVMAADGAHIMPRDEYGQPTDSGGVMLLDGVSLTAEPSEYLTMTTDAVTLSREYNIGAMSESADRTALQRQVETAYERVAADAARAGVFIAPVIARATLRDAAGAVVWRGPEVLLTVPGANIFDRSIEIEMQDNRTVGMSTRDVPSYCIRVRVDPGKVQAWNERASRLEIEVAPQFHPWSASSTYHGTVTVARRQSGGTNVLVTMPALEYGLSANWPARSAYLVKVVTSIFDKVARVTATVLNPLEHGIDTVVGCKGWPGLKEESAALVSALTKGKALLSPAEVELRRVLAPHGFSARCVAVGGAAVAWGNVSIDRYCGYTAADMATETRKDVGWTSSTKVTFVDGTSAVHNAAGTDNAPERLGSLITYPDATARCIDVTVEYNVDGSLPRHWHIELEPDASGTRAIAFEPTLKGHAGIDDASAWISEPRSRRAMPIHKPGLCLAAHPDRPLEPLALLDTDTVIRNIAVARGAGGHGTMAAAVSMFFVRTGWRWLRPSAACPRWRLSA